MGSALGSLNSAPTSTTVRPDKQPQSTTTTADTLYKLTYFDHAGVAEPIRYIFAYAGIPFEDERLVWGEDWQSDMKTTYPWGKLPVLTTPGGLELSQSATICRYLARKFNLIGKDEFETARCDELVEFVNDVRDAWVKFYMESPLEEKKKRELAFQFVDQTCILYNKLTRIFQINARAAAAAAGIDYDENTVVATFYSVGNQVTWTDLYIGYYLEFFETDFPSTISVFPLVEKFKAQIEALPGIQEWIKQTRPPRRQPYY